MRFCKHAFGLDVYNVFGTSGLLKELQEGPGGSQDGSTRLQDGLVKVIHFWSTFLAKNVPKIDPKGIQKFLENWFKN